MEKLVLYINNNATYHARGYEFPVIIPPLPNSDSYGATVFKQIMDNDATTQARFSTLYPNPATGQCFLDYNLPADQIATITLYDMSGKAMRQDRLVGNGRLTWSTDQLSTGAYYYQIQQNDQTIITQKIVVIH